MVMVTQPTHALVCPQSGAEVIACGGGAELGKLFIKSKVPQVKEGLWEVKFLINYSTVRFLRKRTQLRKDTFSNPWAAAGKQCVVVTHTFSTNSSQKCSVATKIDLEKEKSKGQKPRTHPLRSLDPFWTFGVPYFE